MHPRKLAEFPTDEHGRRFQICPDQHVVTNGWSVKSMQHERVCVCVSRGMANMVCDALDFAAKEMTDEGH